MTAAINDAPGLAPTWYRSLFDNNPQPQCVYDASSLQLLAANDAAASHFGYLATELVQMALPQLYHADEVEALRRHLNQPLGAQPCLGRWRHRHSSGACVSVDTVTQEFEWEGVRAHLLLINGKSQQDRATRSPDLEVSELLESIPHAFFTLDHEWRFGHINERALEMLHRPRRDMQGRNIWEVFPKGKDSVFYAEYAKIMAGAPVTSFEVFYPPNNSWREVELCRIASGLAVHYRDATEKHRKRDQLIEERDTLVAVINASADAIVTVSADRLILTANPGAERIFGRPAQSLIGQPVEALMPARYRGAHPDQHAEFLASDDHSRMMGLGRVKGLDANGQELDLVGSITKMTVGKQPITLISLRDVTARVCADAEIERSQTQLSELTQRLMAQEKALVRNIAQSLHDQLGQTIAAIRMAHETMVALHASTESPELTRLQSQQSMLIGQAMRQVRQVLTDLRPTLLEEQGLAAALDNELRNRAQLLPAIDFSINVVPPADTVRWPNNVEYAAFMVVREAVENAVRHSGSQTVQVQLAGDAELLELEITDEGSGMPVETNRHSSHLGILGMHERARAIGATVSVRANKPSGTHVYLHWQAAP